MLIDCDSCRVRGPACGDCVVTVLLGAPPEGVRLEPEERMALDVLAASGLVPPLRQVVLGPPAEDPTDVDWPSDIDWPRADDSPSTEEPELAPGVVMVHRHDKPHYRRSVG